MKNILRNLRNNRLTLSVVMVSAVLFAACRKSDSNHVDIPAAALMAFNVAPDKPAIGIALSGNTINQSPLGYTSFTGQYLNIYPGNRSIEAYDYNSNTSFATSDYSFDPDKYYSLFVVGADSSYRNVVALDNFDSLSGSNGKAYLRYLNAIPDSSNPVVKISAAGQEVANSPAAFATISEFTEVTPGSVNISVSNNGNINANRVIELSERKAYTVLLLGKPGDSDTAKAVQIRFIENGTLSDTASGQ
jgi:hypothetical protein